MKRLFTLFVLMCMAVGLADVAVAQDAPTTKTRYVYVWDVTASIIGKENNAKGLYKSMFDFFSRDVGNKPANAEIVIVPFNDKVLESEIRTLRKDQFDKEEMRILGDSLMERHRRAFRNNPGSQKTNPTPDPYKGGYTDIATALYYVSDNYFKGDCKTYYILLTDCGQEYVHEEGDNPYINLADKPAAQRRLQTALTHINRRMHEHNSRLTYVLFDDDDPRDGASDSLETDRIDFVDATDVSKSHHFCDISASLDFEVMSSRDDSYEIELNITDGYTLPEGLKLIVDDGISRNTVNVVEGKAEVPCKDRFDVGKDDIQVQIELEAVLPGNNGEVVEGANVYHYSFMTGSLSFKVTNNFMPKITVTTSADCSNWGVTEYYSSVPWKKYEPVVMEQDVLVKLDNSDACKLFAGKGKVEFYVSASDDEFEQPEDIVMYYNGEECEDYHFTVALSGVTPKDTKYEVVVTLGFEFTEGASLNDHALYIGHEGIVKSIGDNYNKVVSLPHVPEHEVKLGEDLTIEIDEDLSEYGIVIIKTEKMNPSVKLLMWILIVVVAVFILSIILCRMMTQKIQVSSITLVGESDYYKRLTIKGYQKVVLTSKRKKQGFFNKLYKGAILYEVNEIWTSDVTFEPRNTRKKCLHISYNVNHHSCDASILERHNSYKLTDLATKKKTDMELG